jgi:flagellar biosynthesis GTPase FlhF
MPLLCCIIGIKTKMSRKNIIKIILMVVFCSVTVPYLIIKHVKNTKLRNGLVAGWLVLILALGIMPMNSSNSSKTLSIQKNVAGIQEEKLSNKNTNKQEVEKAQKAKVDQIQKEKDEADRKAKMAKEEADKSELAKIETERKAKEEAEINRVKEEQAKQETLQIQQQQPVTQQQNIISTPPKQIINQPEASLDGFIPGTCIELKKRGLGNWPKGDVNYTSSRDRDKDGIACNL